MSGTESDYKLGWIKRLAVTLSITSLASFHMSSIVEASVD